MKKENEQMREIFKRPFIYFSQLLIFLLLIIFSSCEGMSLSDIKFGEDIRTQIEDDLAVTYSFYEYPDAEASHIDKVFITGRTIDKSSFPAYVHEDTLLVGWQYFTQEELEAESTTKKLPSNFSLDKKGYISSIKVGNTAEKLYAVWKTKCTVNFETNMPDITLDPVILPEGDLLPYPKIDGIHGKYRLNGWYTDPDFENPYDFEQPVMGDFTLYAEWVEFVTITLHRNDGSTENEYNRMTYNCPINTSFNFSMFDLGFREGYGFVGWSTSADGEVEYYSDDVIENCTQDMEFWAVWTTDIVKITYIDKSGNFENKYSQYGRGAHVRIGMVLRENEYWYNWLRNEWTIDGKEIAGYSESDNADVNNLDYGAWGDYYLKDSQGNAILGEDGYYQYANYIAIKNDMTLYAYWHDIEYTLSFRYYDLNDHEIWFGNDQTVKWNECAVCPEDVPLVPGKTFENWYLATWVNGEYLISSTPFDFNTVFNDENFNGYRYIVLYAKFTDNGLSTGQLTSSITFEESPDSDILMDSVTINSSTNSITLAAPSIYTDYRWFINGEEKSTYYNQSTITINTSDWVSGKYDVMLGVKSGTNYYSWQGTLYKN